MKQPNSLFLDLNDTTRYQAWRDQKLSQMPASIDQYLVPVKDPVRLSADEYNAIHDLLQRSNMAIFVADPDEARNKTIPVNISSQFGMHRLDHNMGADHDGVSELTVRSGQWRGGYIPYTNKPIHWHTDGYYNEERRKINGMVLYCVQNALRGGENALLDHEIAYIHLRDSNPEYIRAFLHPQAMTIPANIINNNEIRPERTGPVFSVNDSGALHMRYTARTRSISWRDDELTREATDCLSEFLASDSPYILRAGLNPGMGLICNNILHDRSGFDEDDNHRR
ncbi:MAG: TauD/TfdA family dioxygenase, partial [Arenicellales bacterium]